MYIVRLCPLADRPTLRELASMGATLTAVENGITVRLVGDDLIECRAVGHLRRTDVLAAQQAIERLTHGERSRFAAMFDGREIVGFEPGLPMLWVRWSLTTPSRFRRTAVVGRQGPMLSIATTFQYLIPGAPIALFTRTEDARRFLESPSAGLERV